MLARLTINNNTSTIILYTNVTTTATIYSTTALLLYKSYSYSLTRTYISYSSSVDSVMCKITNSIPVPRRAWGMDVFNVL